MNNLKAIFKTKRPLIGMIHFPPLIGYPDYPGFDYIAQKMLTEAKILEKAGFDGMMIENNYDIPHAEKIPTISAVMFGSLAQLLQQEINIPFGINALWNDYETSLSICASTSASFFRVPAFVDTVKTSYGVMAARANKITKLRDSLKLKHIGIFADIQVKHSEMVDKKKPLAQSAKEAVQSGAQAIIVTGKWTGDSPKTDDLEIVRQSVGNFPILIGSGATIENLPLLAQYADGIIVGTALKEGRNMDKSKEINLKPFSAKVSFKNASKFSREFNKFF